MENNIETVKSPGPGQTSPYPLVFLHPTSLQIKYIILTPRSCVALTLMKRKQIVEWA